MSRLSTQAFESSIVSVRNELAVYDALHDVCEKKLAKFPTRYVCVYYNQQGTDGTVVWKTI